jgi:transposase
MRVATLFKRLLGLGRERVVGIEIQGEGAHQEVVVEIALPTRRRTRCGRCDRVVRGIYDRSTRSWRHLDLMRVRCTLRAEVRRVDCPCCGVVAERVPWARAGPRHTRGFEETEAVAGQPN